MEKKEFAPKQISKENLERIFMEGQSSKESTSARYLFLFLKLASNKVSRLRDTKYHADVIVSRLRESITQT